MKVLIVGAGPTGLTAAIELARKGIKPKIIDRREGLSTLSRAVGITPRSLEILSHSGASETLIVEGIPMDGLRVYFGQSLSLKMPLRSERSYHPNLVCLPQDRTEAIMADALSKYGVEVKYGLKFVALSQTVDSVSVKYDDGNEETFDHVIGADGIRSMVREQAGIAYEGFDLEEQWAVADVDVFNWRHPGCLTVVQAGPGTVAVVVPIGKDRYRVVASRDSALEALPLPIDITNVRREGLFTISVRIAETYSKGNIHLAGDAAHAHSPVGGRGMNLGVADAAELAQRLVNGELEGYTQSRHAEALEARAITERGRLMSTGPNLGRRIVFRALVGAASMLSPIKRKIGSFIVEF